MKGMFFTMDASVALLITMLVIASVVSVMAVSEQSSGMLQLSRIARDVYEIKRLDPSASVPEWIKTDCDSAEEVAVENALYYNTVSGSVEKYEVKVCK